MRETRLCALEQLGAFLEGTGRSGSSLVVVDEGRYSYLQAVLKRVYLLDHASRSALPLAA
jgi:hypothetical protein